MRRRAFITLLGGAAAAWPLAARAQQVEQMRRIGVLMNTGADEPESQARLAAFMQGLQELGWAAGRNLRIDHRWSPGDLARLRKDAAELVALRPEIILAGVGATTSTLQQVTRTIPIVMRKCERIWTLPIPPTPRERGRDRSRSLCLSSTHAPFLGNGTRSSVG